MILSMLQKGVYKHRVVHCTDTDADLHTTNVKVSLESSLLSALTPWHYQVVWHLNMTLYAYYFPYVPPTSQHISETSKLLGSDPLPLVLSAGHL